MYLYLKLKSLYGRAHKKMPPKISCLLPSRTEKVHAKKFPFDLVPNRIQLVPKTEGK